MKYRIAFSVLFSFILALLIYTLLFVRIYDITLDDSFGLLSRMPPFYVPVLFLSGLLCLLAFYYKKNQWSIAFSSLFIMFFAIAPWFIEPLRVIDTFYHFSAVTVVLQDGYLPLTAPTIYYFNYPGSTFFGSALLMISGIDNMLFLKIVFPIVEAIIFYSGFAVIVKKIFGSWSPVGPSFLLITLFGYGGFLFSPFAFGWMLIPILLLLLMSRANRPSSLCFIILSFALVFSHPSTTAFLLVVLPTLVLFFILTKKFSYRRLNSLMLCIPIFIVFGLSWSYFFASFTLDYVILTIKSAIQTLFGSSHALPGMILQNQYFLVGISLLRRTYVIITGIFAIVILGLAIKRIWHTPKKNLGNFTEWLSLSVVFICLGLLLFILFSISSMPDYSFTYAYTFGLFGVSMIAGLLLSGSKKPFFFLLIITVLLIVPAFITSYPYESYNLIREPIMTGMKFTGTQLNYSSAKIFTPFATQLYSFINYDGWDNVVDVSYSKPILFDQGHHYFIFRTDSIYYAAPLLNGSINQIPYQDFGLIINNGYNLIYSNPDYVIFSKLTENNSNS